MRLAQIELAFDAPARLVLEVASAIEVIDQVPFRLDQLKLDVIAELDLLFVAGVVS